MRLQMPYPNGMDGMPPSSMQYSMQPMQRQPSQDQYMMMQSQQQQYMQSQAPPPRPGMPPQHPQMHVRSSTHFSIRDSTKSKSQ